MGKIKLRKPLTRPLRVGICLKPLFNVNIHSTSLRLYFYFAITPSASSPNEFYRNKATEQEPWPSQATFRQGQGVVESLEERAPTGTGKYALCLVDEGLIV